MITAEQAGEESNKNKPNILKNALKYAEENIELSMKRGVYHTSLDKVKMLFYNMGKENQEKFDSTLKKLGYKIFHKDSYNMIIEW